MFGLLPGALDMVDDVSNFAFGTFEAVFTVGIDTEFFGHIYS
jgi:hypothetical protein